MGWQQAVEKTVTGLGFELVDCERSARGLLVVYIDRLPGHTYPGGPGDVVTVDDCESVTRQLQHVLEVEGCDYERLEVSSPGLDRPLKQPADFLRFAGGQVDVSLKQPFQGRKKYRGLLRVGHAGDAAAQAFEVVFNDGKEDQVLTFTLPEIREARLVPVLPFKGRHTAPPAGTQERKKRQSNAKARSGMSKAQDAHDAYGAVESGGHKQ
jgi:ribosome maturation factor RimP